MECELMESDMPQAAVVNFARIEAIGGEKVTLPWEQINDCTIEQAAIEVAKQCDVRVWKDLASCTVVVERDGIKYGPFTVRPVVSWTVDGLRGGD